MGIVAAVYWLAGINHRPNYKKVYKSEMEWRGDPGRRSLKLSETE